MHRAIHIFFAILFFAFLSSQTAIAQQSKPLSLDAAITEASKKISNSLAKGTRLAVINCASASEELSAYVVDSITGALVDSQKFVIVERKDIHLVKNELNYHLSGDVSDESAQSIGKFLGAEVIISCSVDATPMLRAKAITVETGVILAVSAVPLEEKGKLESLWYGGANGNRRVVRVTNTQELLEAIGPDRIIKIAAGYYDLSTGYTVKNRYVSWVDEYDGPCPVIKSVSNLSFVGENNPVIVLKPAYGWVFSFETCTDIGISGITFGHTVPGQCMGGVLRFKNCENVEVSGCELYGSGTYGVGLERTSGFLMEHSVIYDCTFGLATIFRSQDVEFTNTTFRDSGEYDLFEITSSTSVYWIDCEFVRNRGASFFSIDADSEDIVIENCDFSSNTVRLFTTKQDTIELIDTLFSDNSFQTPED